MSWDDNSYLLHSKPAYYCYAISPNSPFQVAPLGFSLSIQLQPGETINVATSLRDESINRLEGLRCLKDGWDGYGAYAPSGAVCGHAIRLINTLAREFPAVPSPEIAPSSNGTVLFSWGGQAGEAVLEIGETNFSGFIRTSGGMAPLEGEAGQLGSRELSAISGYIG